MLFLHSEIAALISLKSTTKWSKATSWAENSGYPWSHREDAWLAMLGGKKNLICR